LKTDVFVLFIEIIFRKVIVRSLKSIIQGNRAKVEEKLTFWVIMSNIL